MITNIGLNDVTKNRGELFVRVRQYDKLCSPSSSRYIVRRSNKQMYSFCCDNGLTVGLKMEIKYIFKVKQHTLKIKPLQIPFSKIVF